MKGKYINAEALKGIRHCIKFTIFLLEQEYAQQFETSEADEINNQTDNNIGLCNDLLKAIRESKCYDGEK